MRTMFRKHGRRILTILLAAVFLFSITMTVRQHFQYQKIDEGNNEALRIAGLLEGEGSASSDSSQSGRGTFVGKEISDGEAASSVGEALPLEAAALTEVNLEALREVNEDIIGWIEIPGTNISYPLLVGENNQYYLTRDWKKEPSSGGSIFVEETNSPDMTDFHTIIYGHRMRNGSMFAVLGEYRDLEFWREHPSIYLVDDQGISRYDIFSAEEAAVNSVVYRTDITESHLEGDFLKHCIGSSTIDTGIVPGEKDSILTLSTCTGHGYRSRWVVHSVLRYRYEKSQ